ncbi:hypothetical protein HZS61_011069 [Fusarium oxysporum f. sp. conglutinans]|uniref:N-acetyltransferase domain-containing protein n=1 Tax=Fusarium oxysporum f. sp. conglutinans TaxID=100902 RepID=A0A8H6LM74_FUSOX|nr:hypothetical protein HZS61_011069 [Fusarium oxysporum f. sp. conglutinans]
MVGLRLWCRRERQMLGLDDVTAVVALACVLGCGSSIVAMTHYGLGRHIYTLSPRQIILYLRCFWISIVFYTYALFAIKLTFLIHYYRIMSVSNMRWLYLGALGFIILWGINQGIGVFLFCIPLQSFWDPHAKGRCFLSRPTMWYVSGVVHIVTDFAIIVMPLPIVWKLQLPRSQKIYLTGIFGLGSLTLAIAILRMQWLDPVADMTWWNVTAASWSMAEIVSGITSRIATSAFHPNTDALSRRLFPPHLQPKDLPDGEAAYDWRFARKASSLASPDSHLVVAIDDEKGPDEKVVGFSLWDAPPASGGDSAPSQEIQCAALDKEAYNEMKKTVNQDAADTFGEQGIAGVWHLDYIGVSPGNQRRGIGKMLLQWGLDNAAAERKDCYLVATEAGRPLYVDAGFKDIRVVSILGVPHYSMILRAGGS